MESNHENNSETENLSHMTLKLYVGTTWSINLNVNPVVGTTLDKCTIFTPKSKGIACANILIPICKLRVPLVLVLFGISNELREPL